MKFDSISLHISGFKKGKVSFKKMWSQPVGKYDIKADFLSFTGTIEDEILDRIMKGERFQITGHKVDNEYRIRFYYDMETKN